MQKSIEDVDEYIMTQWAEPLLWELQFKTNLRQGTIVRINYSAAYWAYIVATLFLTNGITPEGLFMSVGFGLLIDYFAGRPYEKAQYGTETARNPRRLLRSLRMLGLVLASAVGLYAIARSDGLIAQYFALLSAMMLFAHEYLYCADMMPPSARKRMEARETAKAAQGASV